MARDGRKVQVAEENCSVPLSFGKIKEAFPLGSAQRQIQYDNQGLGSEQVCLHREKKAAHARN